MRTIVTLGAVLALAACALWACSSAPPEGVGGAGPSSTVTGSGGDVSTTSTTSSAPSSTTSSATMPPWTVGIEKCLSGGPLVDSNYSTAYQRLDVPAGGTVERVAIGVARYSGDPVQPDTGGPFAVRWGVSAAASVAPATHEEALVDESALVWMHADGHMAFAEVTLPIPIQLGAGEAFWVGGGLDRPGAPPSNVVICYDPATTADTAGLCLTWPDGTTADGCGLAEPPNVAPYAVWAAAYGVL